MKTSPEKRAANKTWREANREKVRADQQRYDAARYAADPEKIKARARASYARHRAARAEYGKRYKAEHRQERIERERIRHYGLNDAGMTVLALRSEGRCDLCGAVFAGSKTVHIDHDHTSGCVRGLLCNRCNSALGTLGDDVAGLRRAIAYLEGSHAA